MLSASGSFCSVSKGQTRKQCCYGTDGTDILMFFSHFKSYAFFILSDVFSPPRFISCFVGGVVMPGLVSIVCEEPDLDVPGSHLQPPIHG